MRIARISENSRIIQTYYAARLSLYQREFFSQQEFGKNRKDERVFNLGVFLFFSQAGFLVLR